MCSYRHFHLIEFVFPKLKGKRIVSEKTSDKPSIPSTCKTHGAAMTMTSLKPLPLNDNGHGRDRKGTHLRVMKKQQRLSHPCPPPSRLASWRTITTTFLSPSCKCHSLSFGEERKNGSGDCHFPHSTRLSPSFYKKRRKEGRKGDFVCLPI